MHAICDKQPDITNYIKSEIPRDSKAISSVYEWGVLVMAHRTATQGICIHGWSYIAVTDAAAWICW